jgi:hypothetical protein
VAHSGRRDMGSGCRRLAVGIAEMEVARGIERLNLDRDSRCPVVESDLFHIHAVARRIPEAGLGHVGIRRWLEGRSRIAELEKVDRKPSLAHMERLMADMAIECRMVVVDWGLADHTAGPAGVDRSQERPGLESRIGYEVGIGCMGRS